MHEVEEPAQGRQSVARLMPWRAILSVVLFSGALNLLMLTGPLFLLQVYDRVIAAHSGATLAVLFALVTFLYAIYACLDYARSRTLARTGLLLHDRLSDALATRPQPFGPSDPAAAAGDLRTVRDFALGRTALTLFDLPWVPPALAVIFLLHPLLGALACAGLLLSVAAQLGGLALSRAAGRAARDLERSEARLCHDAAGVLRTFAPASLRTALRKEWGGLVRAAGREMTTAGDLAWTGWAATRALRLFLPSAMVALGAWLVLDAQITPGAIIAAAVLLGRLTGPVEEAATGADRIAELVRAWRRIDGALAVRPAPAEAMARTRAPATLAIAHVSLAGPAGYPALRDITLEIEPGGILGVAGPSGAGKTALARVAAGLVLPATGTVRFGGVLLRSPAQSSTHLPIGYLPQDIRFFAASVARNIAHLDAVPDPAAVAAAVRAARLEADLAALPAGPDTMLDDRAPPLPRGLLQRIALARALYGDPALLILDDPTAHLDATGSEALAGALGDWRRAGKPALVLSNRRSALRCCDRIALIEAGRIVAHDRVLQGLPGDARPGFPAVARAS